MPATLRSLSAAAASLALAAAAAISLAPALAAAQTPLSTSAPYPGPYGVAPPVITDWDAGRPVPPDYHEQQRIRLPLVVAGSVIFGAFYLPPALGAVIGAAGGHGSGGVGAIPIVGPFALMPTLHGSAAALDFFLVADGLAQAAGAAMLITGLAAPRRVLVRDVAGIHVVPTPMTFGKSSAGLGLTGTF